MKFIKMQAAGNDYVYVDCFKEKIENPGEIAIKVSDRHFGVGSDGLILICPSDIADVKMDMYNADGSRGLMCGNGSRCVAKYAYDHGYVKSKNFTMETGAGIKYIEIEEKDGVADYINVNMGKAFITSEFPEKISINGEEKEFIGVDVGNPHAVYYVDSLDELKIMNLEAVGEYYERHKRFPDKVNSEFIYVEKYTYESMGEGLGRNHCLWNRCLCGGFCHNEERSLRKSGQSTSAWGRFGYQPCE